jgi:hypothetical protein
MVHCMQVLLKYVILYNFCIKSVSQCAEHLSTSKQTDNYIRIK